MAGGLRAALWLEIAQVYSLKSLGLKTKPLKGRKTHGAFVGAQLHPFRARPG